MKFGVENVRPGAAFVIGPDGTRWFITTRVRARAIAAALNTPEGQAAFIAERAEALKTPAVVDTTGV